MNAFSPRIFAALLVWIAMLLAPLAAADAPWQVLFNGKDLTGWKANAYPDSWSVVDGAIRACATKESSHLFFVGEGQGEFVRFKNFELELMARGEPEANSGVFIHTDLATQAAALRLSHGYEIQLNSTAKEPRKTGSLYAVIDLPTSPVDETKWFPVRIVVQGPRILVQIAGKTTVDYTEPGNARAERPKGREGRVLNPQGGGIALQAHDPKSVFYFKDIRLRPLP